MSILLWLGDVFPCMCQQLHHVLAGLVLVLMSVLTISGLQGQILCLDLHSMFTLVLTQKRCNNRSMHVDASDETMLCYTAEC